MAIDESLVKVAIGELGYDDGGRAVRMARPKASQTISRTAGGIRFSPMVVSYIMRSDHLD